MVVKALNTSRGVEAFCGRGVPATASSAPEKPEKQRVILPPGLAGVELAVELLVHRGLEFRAQGLGFRV